MFPANLRIPAILWGVLLVAATVLGGVAPGLGSDFRLDNKVFVGNSTQPESQGSTIFHEGLVIDFLGSATETIIFDPPSANGKGRFILLDSSRKMATELTTREVADFGQGLKQWAAERRDPLATFLVEPQFEEKFDAQTAQLTLSSKLMTYTVQLTPPVQRDMVDQYRVFSDWYARLNTVLNRGPGSRPPFARLILDEAIARRQAIPREVRLTFPIRKGGSLEQTTMRSQHQLTPQLTKADLEAVAGVMQNLKVFKPVRFEQYRKRD